MKNCEGITEIFVDRYANSLTHTKFGSIIDKGDWQEWNRHGVMAERIGSEIG
jgi:hypothetical protein